MILLVHILGRDIVIRQSLRRFRQGFRIESHGSVLAVKLKLAKYIECYAIDVRLRVRHRFAACSQQSQVDLLHEILHVLAAVQTTDKVALQPRMELCQRIGQQPGTLLHRIVPRRSLNRATHSY